MTCGALSLWGGTPLALGAAGGAGRRAEFVPLRRNVGYFTGRGGTIGYLQSPDALVAVDAQRAQRPGELCHAHPQLGVRHRAGAVGRRGHHLGVAVLGCISSLSSPRTWLHVN